MVSMDQIVGLLTEGGAEQIFTYLPVFIIGIGIIVLLASYLKENWKTIREKLPQLKQQPAQKPEQAAGQLPPEKIEPETVTQQKPKRDYKKEVEAAINEKDPTQAMGRLSILINQYFSNLLNINAMTYEEIMDETSKRGDSQLKNFFENIMRTEFSKDEVSRKELLIVANEFISMIKAYPLKETDIPLKKTLIQKITILNRLRRFEKELQRDLEKKTTLQEKINKAAEKIGKSAWNFLKSHFSAIKTPKKVSLTAVLEDIEKSKPRKKLGKIFGEEQPTVEGFLYFIYLTLRKKIREKKKAEQIGEIIKKGHALLKKNEAVGAKEVYNTILPLYNALSDDKKREVLPEIALFYEGITDCINFQRAMMNMLQLKMALKSRKYETAKQAYSRIAEIYEQLPSDYKNEIYEKFLDLEKELDTAENKGGK